MNEKYIEIDFASLVGSLLVRVGTPNESDVTLDYDKAIMKLDIEISRHIKHLCLFRKNLEKVLKQGYPNLIINEKYIMKGLTPDHEKSLKLMINSALTGLVNNYFFENKRKIPADDKGNFCFSYDKNWQIYMLKPQTVKTEEGFKLNGNIRKR